MNPDHLAAVWVEGEGAEYVKPKFATGYPITPGLILTVAHLFKPGWSRVTIQIPKLRDPVVTITGDNGHSPLVWDGRDGKSNGLDAALIACKLPDGIRESIAFLEKRPSSSINWLAYGYPEFVRPDGKPGRPFDCRGEFSPPQDGPDFELECISKNPRSKAWGGASGGPIFVKGSNDLAGIFCGVRHHGGETAIDGNKVAPIERLLGVPAWKIIHAAGFRDVFRPADQNREADFHRADDDWYTKLANYLAAAFQSDSDARVSAQFASVFGESLRSGQPAVEAQVKELIRNRSADRTLPRDLVRFCTACRKLGMNSVAEAVDVLVLDLIPTMLTPEERRQIRDLLESAEGGFVEVTWNASAAICVAAFGRDSLDNHSLSRWSEKIEDWVGPNGKSVSYLNPGDLKPVQIAMRILDQLCSGELEQEARPEVIEIREQWMEKDASVAAMDSVEVFGVKRGALLNSRLEERRFDYGISFCVFKTPATVPEQSMNDAIGIVSRWVPAMKFLRLSSENTFNGVIPSFERLKLTHEGRRKNQSK